MKYYIGIDLGGTNIVAAVVDEDYNIITKASTKTNRPRPAEAIADDMAAMAIKAVEDANLTMDQIEWVGVGTPGIANSSTGIIEYSNNLGFENTPMAKLIQKHIDKPVFIENDANAAAYGEYVAGAAKGAKNAVCITLGTGVGGGIIIEGKIYAGSNFGGAEIGHTVINLNGPKCSCGRCGCFEVFSSATGLIRMTKEKMDVCPDSLMHKITEERGGKVSARTSFDAMRQADAEDDGVRLFGAADGFGNRVVVLRAAFRNFVDEFGAEGVDDAAIVIRFIENALQNRHMARRRARVVGDERLVVVGGRPDDGDGFQGVFIQRQDVLVIFEQDDATPRTFES